MIRTARNKLEARVERVLDELAAFAGENPEEGAALTDAVLEARGAFDARKTALGLIRLAGVFRVAATVAQKLERALSREARVDG